MSLLRNLSKELYNNLYLHQVNLALEFQNNWIMDGKIILNSPPDWVNKEKYKNILSINDFFSKGALRH